MTRFPLARLELNLLDPLDALLTERSVTRAARRLGLSQPSLSASLARLRVIFDDPILVRDGNEFHLTPLARRLAEQTPGVLSAARRLFDTEAAFDPSTSEREFVLYGSDYSSAVVGTAVAAAVQAEAPRVRFRFLQQTNAVLDDPNAGLRPVDGLLVPRGSMRGALSLDVYSDTWKVLADPGNAVVGDSLSAAAMSELPWVVPYSSTTMLTPAQRQLAISGIDPQVEIVVEGFLVVPHFVVGTNRIGLVLSRIADRIAGPLNLRVLSLPGPEKPIRGALWWHPSHTDDPAHQWLRDRFVQHGPRVRPGS